jgi:hypothetical protein
LISNDENPFECQGFQMVPNVQGGASNDLVGLKMCSQLTKKTNTYVNV